ncbi:type II toxin-antitoxin system RatA family toxin [Kordiimonas aestuarii]|uniref:type II toxin-antitoxin system RatA family toxin n=1 Tax=Kordiimonas aestuarii TaxID=1005925 RepID=UPI0021CE9D88|nr:type II toxin-antitoxin system RatA family toxin [Kordiimonas aestuarii]
MPRFTEKKTLPYTQEQLFTLVSDVAKYPEFLPWCTGARVYNRRQDQFDADVIIGFKMFSERFTSRVRYEEYGRVDVDYIKGPMKRLYNHWRFRPVGLHSCQIDFEVEFEFSNRMLNQMIGGLFGEACKKMVHAFETRAEEIYGVPKRANP